MKHDGNTLTRVSRSVAWMAALSFAVVLSACKPGSPTDPAQETFSVTLEWTAPSVDAAGGPLDDLVGYRVHYRSASPANGTGATTSDIGEVTRATVSGVPVGTWFFGVTARDAAGNESDLSNEVRVEVGP